MHVVTALALSTHRRHVAVVGEGQEGIKRWFREMMVQEVVVYEVS